jgi:hypothetical protein
VRISGNQKKVAILKPVAIALQIFGVMPCYDE